MAHISYRVSGKKDGKPATRRFPDSREGRKERDSFAETLADPRVVIDVRIRIGGREVSRTFTRRKDADSYAATKEVDKLRGLFIDPRERRVTVEAVAARWLESNPGKRPNTLVSDDLALRLYIVPAWVVGASVRSSPLMCRHSSTAGRKDLLLAPYAGTTACSVPSSLTRRRMTGSPVRLAAKSSSLG